MSVSDKISVPGDMVPAYGGRQPRKTTNGFSLVVVLISLTIVLMLYATVTQSLLTPQLTLRRLSTETERQLSAQAALAQLRPLIADAMLEPSGQSAIVVPDLDGTPFDIEHDSNLISVSAQDIGGLIDLNAGAPEIIQRLFETVDLINGAEFAERLLVQRTGSSFDTVADALSGLGLNDEARSQVEPLLTVQSGNRHLNPDTIPTALVEALGFTNRAQLIDELGGRVFRRGQVEEVRVRLR